MKQEMTFNVNGEHYTVRVDIRRTLLEVLRETLGLTGTKEMCNKGRLRRLYGDHGRKAHSLLSDARHRGSR